MYPVNTIKANIDVIIAEIHTLMLFIAEFAVTSEYIIISAAADTAAQDFNKADKFFFSSYHLPFFYA